MFEYEIVFHPQRNQPFTVWREWTNKRGELVREVMQFCRTLREAETYIARRHGN